MLTRFAAWSDWLKATDHADKTVRDYRYWLLRYVAETLTDPWYATEDDLVAYLAALTDRGMSRQMFLRAVTSYWRWAAPKAHRNPTERLHLRRPREAPAPVLCPTEVRALIRAAFRREPRRGWAILLMASTGVRVASLVALRSEDVIEGKVAWLRTAKAGRTYEVQLRKAAQLAARHLIDESYPTLIGVDCEGFRRWLRRAALDAGITRRVWPHLLRHSFATALGKVTDPATWMAAMGHADLSQYPRYTHPERERIAEATEAAQVW